MVIQWETNAISAGFGGSTLIIGGCAMAIIFETRESEERNLSQLCATNNLSSFMRFIHLHSFNWNETENICYTVIMNENGIGIGSTNERRKKKPKNGPKNANTEFWFSSLQTENIIMFVILFMGLLLMIGVVLMMCEIICMPVCVLCFCFLYIIDVYSLFLFVVCLVKFTIDVFVCN